MGKAARRSGRANRSRESAAPLTSKGPAGDDSGNAAPPAEFLEVEEPALTVGALPHVASASTLCVVSDALQAVERERQTLADAVRAAHDDGHTWATIASVLGVSRQSAHARFGP